MKNKTGYLRDLHLAAEDYYFAPCLPDTLDCYLGNLAYDYNANIDMVINHFFCAVCRLAKSFPH